MDRKRAIVSGLDSACQLVDEIAYRPAVVRLTERLPRWWQCEFAKVSMWLDARWEVGYWDLGADRTLAPGGPCDVCHRRPASVEVGGTSEDLGIEPAGSYMEAHPLQLCFWCKLPEEPIEGDEQLAVALADARERSISWRWRWRLGVE